MKAKSKAPDSIWVWWDNEYDVGMVNTHGDKRYTPFEAREYAPADRIEELEAEVKSMAMDCLVAHGQASDAYEAQLLAEAKLQDQTRLIEQLFALLDIKEQKDDGRYFHPNIIRSSRALDAVKLEEILGKLRGYIND